MLDISLWLIVLAVLVLPFSVRKIEENLELFLFAMGATAATISSMWSGHLIRDALVEPVGISLVVLGVGAAFYYGQTRLDALFARMAAAIPLRWTVGLLIVILGLVSSLITAIIASLVLVEAIHLLRLERKQEVRITVLACFSIGLGAALTPVGEPLSTIVTAKMDESFGYLFRLIGAYIVPGVLILGVLTGLALNPGAAGATLSDLRHERRLRDVILRAVRVFCFVAALILLGAGLTPLVDRYIVKLPAPGLFWINMISAILDNATLAAAEVGPVLSVRQLTGVLLGLLISGGMLIPGNIPNIIAANRLGIGSREWARVGVPVGLVLMLGYFLVWLVSA